MIFVDLKGRIGNQLFIYAFAECIRQRRGGKEKIVFYDEDIRNCNWYNALEDYHLDNVEFVHNKSSFPILSRIQSFLTGKFYQYYKGHSASERINYEKKFQKYLNSIGIIACYNGYLESSKLWRGSIYLQGYFQSEKYFDEIKSLIRDKMFAASKGLYQKEYVKRICERETICISVKVEHNAGSAIYDVCGRDYYKKAIELVLTKVEKPFFFICSDNVNYVLKNLIDADKYDYVCQEKDLSVIDSLNIMGLCKHFIIGNTSFGWWAQFLSNNPNKIVVAPKPWLRTDESEYIYCKGWNTIDVSDYIAKTRNEVK